MRRRDKSFIKTLVFLIALFTLALGFLNTSDPEISHTPVDFYGTSREVSLKELVEVANKFNLSIYLPSELPNDLELTAIYLRDNSFLAIVVYSADGNKDYKTAELGIQITPSSPEFTPTYDGLRSEAGISEFKMALEINSWPVLVNEKTDWGGNKASKEKYGDYTLTVKVPIDQVRYNIGAPTLNVDTTVNLVRSMSLLTS